MNNILIDIDYPIKIINNNISICKNRINHYSRVECDINKTIDEVLKLSTFQELLTQLLN